ncbi:alpha/beta fold hydrolase [Nocardia takedensis]|uniref:alpha/beta fold hydrolase n=1 Tax=Nocardia takedensis TaxID=259390 RepID=UPI0002FE2AC4|nr:alpha/beta hydrolase [Nocardia takedensis]
MASITALTASAARRGEVRTADGVRLAVREYGPRRAALTVVLLHGHCLRAESWAAVRDDLLREHGDLRVVSYDHRGHGESAAGDRRTYTLDQLADDLREVLDALVPTGPVVLVGHSMGGMTALTYAARHPHDIGSRVVGVALIATAAHGLADAGFGRLLRNPLVSAFQGAVRHAPGLMQRVKKVAGRVFGPVIRTAEFGDRRVGPQVLALANAMHNQTPIVTMAGFLREFMDYDRRDALPILSRVPTVVLCGSADLMTPPAHSVAMAAAVDYADLVLIEGAGHSVLFERPAPVAEALTRLLSRAVADPTPVAAAA